RQEILHLCELHLELAVRAVGPLGENVEDKLRTIDNLEVGGGRNVGALRRRDIPVDNENVRIELHGADDDLIEFAATHHKLRVDAIAHPDHDVRHFDSGGAGELPQLPQGDLRLAGVFLV